MWTAVQAGNESIFMKREAGAMREGEKERGRERTYVLRSNEREER